MSEQFSGHGIEAGLLQRLRTWRDVLPPLILFQSLRVCGSPIYVAMSLVTVIAISAILSGGEVDSVVAYPKFANRLVFHSVRADGRDLVLILVAFVVGILPAAATMRSGAIYAAQRDAEPIMAGLRLVRSRAISMLLVLLLPMVCVLGLLAPVAALALADRVPGIGDAIAELLGALISPLVIVIGLIGAGSIVAIPLGWASLSIEKRNDPFDALSRGYEYLYRRPVQLAFYLVINVLTAQFLGWMANWVAYTADGLSSLVYRLGSGGESLPIAIRVVLAHLPLAVTMTAFFAVLGAVYLLLRKDANEQEIEEIVVSTIDQRTVDLPSL